MAHKNLPAPQSKDHLDTVTAFHCMDVFRRLAKIAPTGYPMIPRFPEWEKAIKDGIVW